MIPVDDLIGAPFLDDARGPKAFDCWGLAMEVSRRGGVLLPDYVISPSNMEKIHAEIKANQLKAIGGLSSWTKSDLVTLAVLVFQTHPIYTQHIGIYLSDDKFIHTSRSTGCIISSLHKPFWSRCFRGSYRYVG